MAHIFESLEDWPLYVEARDRVRNTPSLAKYERIIMAYQHPHHLAWLAKAPEAEVVDWATELWSFEDQE